MIKIIENKYQKFDVIVPKEDENYDPHFPPEYFPNPTSSAVHN